MRTCDIGMTLHNDCPAPLKTAIENYVATFAKPPEVEAPDGLAFEGHDCLKCGRPQCGLTGYFRWGIVHGEGNCTECGWPARAYHEIVDPDGGKPLARFSRILQYHPSVVVERSAAAREAAE